MQHQKVIKYSYSIRTSIQIDVVGIRPTYQLLETYRLILHDNAFFHGFFNDLTFGGVAKAA